jgi:hypothetical protein
LLRSLQEIQPGFVEEAKAQAGLWSQVVVVVVKTMPGKHPVNFLQKKKTAVLGALHVIRKAMQYEITLSGVLHHWFKKRSTRGKETCDEMIMWSRGGSFPPEAT